MSLVEVSTLAGMLVKYEEDFILCSKIDEAMKIIPDENNIPIIGRKNYKEDINTEKLYEINL